jgi:hypothetical protein
MSVREEEPDFIQEFWGEMDPGFGRFREKQPSIDAMWAQAVRERRAASLIKAEDRSYRRSLVFAIGEEAYTYDSAARIRWLAAATAEDGSRFDIDYGELLIIAIGRGPGTGPDTVLAKTLVEVGDAARHVWSNKASDLRDLVLQTPLDDSDTD